MAFAWTCACGRQAGADMAMSRDALCAGDSGVSRSYTIQSPGQRLDPPLSPVSWCHALDDLGPFLGEMSLGSWNAQALLRYFSSPAHAVSSGLYSRPLALRGRPLGHEARCGEEFRDAMEEPAWRSHIGASGRRLRTAVRREARARFHAELRRGMC